MMHQFKNDKILISIVNDLYFEGLVFREKFRHIYIYNISILGIENLRKRSVNCIEYLDCFIIVLPVKYALQPVMWNDFYTYFGENYEKLIDVHLNIRCIDTLYAYLCEKVDVSNSTVILDYGCGTGLSIAKSDNCILLGYEPNGKMRGQAVRRGMRVLDYQQLYLLPDFSIDAMFSSFVFHMGITGNDIQLLRRIIRREGVIVANFYKNINCSLVNDLFAQYGFCVNEVDGFDERLGNVYEYKRK